MTGLSSGVPGQPAGCVLVLAKAPEPGRVKTRLTPPATPAEAADIAAAALLDTLDAIPTTGARTAVALTGRLARSARGAAIRSQLRRCLVLPQRGRDFGDRLAHAHLDVRRLHPRGPVLQIGMDTPQVTAELLTASCAPLHSGRVDGVLGMAADGGWWALGLRDPRHAAVLRSVPMSRSDTGERTLRALRVLGLRIASLPELVDVDAMRDAVQVAAMVPASRFARAVAAVAVAGPADGRVAGPPDRPGADRSAAGRDRVSA